MLRTLLVLAFAMIVTVTPAQAQDDGARVYQLQPIGSRIVTAFAVAKRGNEGPELGTINPGVETDTNLFVLRYVQTFDVAGRAFSPFVIVPIGEVESSGAPRSAGFGDAQVGATIGLFGAPALSRDEYAAFRPGFGVSLFGRVFFPTGEYRDTQPVNLGANRAAYQLGLPTVFAWGASYRDPSLTTLEILPTVTFYDDNDDPFVGGQSAKDPLLTVESHLTHNVSQRVWVSADMLYRRGGETVTDGVGDDDGTHGWSAGGTLAFPVARASIVLTYEHVVERSDDGPDGWFFRTALILPL
ncbi:MAG: transporter [Longimicrobiales bacterium]